MITIAVSAGVLLLIIWLAIRFRAARWILLSIPVALVIAFMVWQTFSGWEQYQHDERVRTLIKPDEIDIQDAVFELKEPSSVRKQREANLKFHLANRSSHTLSGLTLRVTLTNCDENGSNCQVAGVADMSGSYIFLAPGAEDEVKRWMKFDSLPPLKKWDWSYELVEIRAKTH